MVPSNVSTKAPSKASSSPIPSKTSLYNFQIRSRLSQLPPSSVKPSSAFTTAKASARCSRNNRSGRPALREQSRGGWTSSNAENALADMYYWHNSPHLFALHKVHPALEESKMLRFWGGFAPN